MFKDNIFREYDIRGVVGKDYDMTFANELARAYGLFVRERIKAPGAGRKRHRVAVGRDVRESVTSTSRHDAHESRCARTSSASPSPSARSTCRPST